MRIEPRFLPAAFGVMSAKIVSTIFANWQGAIAQLGERLLCKQEVAGSIPAGSTSSPPDPHRAMTRAHANQPVGCLCSRDRAHEAGSAGDANERIVCSLTIRKSFCFDAKFSSER